MEVYVHALFGCTYSSGNAFSEMFLESRFESFVSNSFSFSFFFRLCFCFVCFSFFKSRFASLFLVRCDFFFPVQSHLGLDQTLFSNGEKARAHNSAKLGIPGLFASVTNVTWPGPQRYEPNYMSACGIPMLASQAIEQNCPITPYAAFPMMLANLSVALHWYASTVSAPGMHSSFGSIESITIDGAANCPLLTWDAKITSFVAAVGGIVDLTRAALSRVSLQDAFLARVTSEWERAFPSPMSGLADFSYPPSNISWASDGGLQFPC